ncbi:MAG: 2Fe-2S iron-sulfur cluster-binding protein [Planctomycetota bacterium]
MPKVTVEGHGEFEVESGKRLVLALEEDAGVDQLHACGGKARCTTCRVEITDGEPSKMTKAEHECLTARELIDQSGLRLSCQVPCEQDMSVRVISRLEGSGRLDAGGPVSPEMEPEPVEWVEK